MERLFAHCFQIELELRSASFCGGRKNTKPEQRPSEQGENQQQTATYEAKTRIGIWMTSVGGELSY